jgi:hypothetical protein
VWVAGVSGFGPEGGLAAACAAVSFASGTLDATSRSLVERLLVAVEAWRSCPCEEHALAVARARDAPEPAGRAGRARGTRLAWELVWQLADMVVRRDELLADAGHARACEAVLSDAARLLAELGPGALDAAQDRLREAVRAALVPWALGLRPR